MNEKIRNLFNSITEPSHSVITIPYEATFIELLALVHEKISPNIEFSVKHVFDKIQICVRNKFSKDSETVLFLLNKLEGDKIGICCPQLGTSDISSIEREDQLQEYIFSCFSENNKYALTYIKTMAELDHAMSDLFLHASDYFTRTESDSQCQIAIDQLEVFINHEEGIINVTNVADPFLGIRLVSEETKNHLKIGTVNGFEFKILSPLILLENQNIQVNFRKNKEVNLIKILR